MKKMVKNKQILPTLLTIAMLVGVAVSALALSSYLDLFNAQYGTTGTKLDSCNVCHTTVPALNPYGTDYAANGNNFVAIETIDSDGDGYTNIDEINAGTFPGKVDSQTISPAVTLLSPNGGELIPSGLPSPITWAVLLPNATSFKVSFSIDNGTTWKLIGTGIPGTSTPWPVPLLTKNKTACLVKITAFDSSNKKLSTDKSDAPFTIEVLTINGIGPCASGQICPITWTMPGAIAPDQLQLSYTFDGGVTWKKELAVAMPLVPSYSWTAPTVNRPKTTKVKLTFKAAGTTVATATSPKFTITGP